MISIILYLNTRNLIHVCNIGPTLVWSVEVHLCFIICNDAALRFWTHCITYFRYFLHPFLYPCPIDWPKPCLGREKITPPGPDESKPSLRIDFLHIHFPPFSGPESNTFTLRITSSAPLNTTRQELYSRPPRQLSYHKLVVCTSISPM